MLPDAACSIIVSAIKKLSADVNAGETFNKMYENLLGHYSKFGEPDVAYVVCYDKNHPEVPVTVVKWRENWESVRKQS